MKKTLIASAVATAISLGSVNVNADIAITSMEMGGIVLDAGGTLMDAGDGDIFSIDPFKGFTWSLTQETIFMDNTGSWSGISPVDGGSTFDYDIEIASMTADQVAVGMFFNWNTANGVAVLEIFDCVADICTGQGVPMANGPFTGVTTKFMGTGSATVTSAVPVPAAAWLMGSGLLGLISMMRRRNRG